ncbi:MAG: DUF362 domain-containing protein [Desulfobacterales bacterium]
MPAKEEKALAITNATFFQAVVQIVKENRGTPVPPESPAIHSLSRVIKKTAYASVVEAEQLEVADPVPTRSLFFDRAKKFPHLDISAAYFDADIILNLPKFKTHGITYITGAVKLLFGAIPGGEKSKMHLRARRLMIFIEYLLDLYGHDIRHDAVCPHHSYHGRHLRSGRGGARTRGKAPVAERYPRGQ